jgi:hypothetical protein
LKLKSDCKEVIAVAPRRPRGRPTKFNRALAEQIIQYIRAGAYIETAAVAAGIDKATFYAWMKKGASAKDGDFKAFHDAVNQAMAMAEVRDVLLIGEAAKESWQAAAWRLERKFPDRWGQTRRVEVEVRKELEAFYDALERKLPPELYEQVLAAVDDEDPGEGAAR